MSDPIVTKYTTKDGIDVTQYTSQEVVMLREIEWLRARCEKLTKILEIFADDKSWSYGGICDGNSNNRGQDLARRVLKAE